MTEKNAVLNGKNSGKETIAKESAIDKTIKDIQERFGEGAIMKLGEVKRVDVEAIPTGSISLDFALGIGGIPKGRIIEIFGAESSGKTTLATHIIASAQKKGGKAAFIDAEHALDPEYAKKIGVNIDELLISQPDTGEQALEIAEALVRSATLDVIVIDSVAALTPKAEIEGEMGDRHIGLQARLMSQALRKLAAITSKTNTCIIFINQTRIKIGVMFGNPETTTGGTALKFYSSVRIEIRKSAQIKQGDNIIGCRAKLKIVKNKVAPPFQKAEFDIMYNEGISLAGDALMLAIDKGIVKRSGAWFSYKEEKIGQGFEGARKFLKENPKVLDSVIQDIKKFESQKVES